MKEEKEYQVFQWLLKGELSFTKLLEMYNAYQQKKIQQNSEIISGLAFPLSQSIDEIKKNDFIKAKGAYWLLKSNVFKTAPVEEEYKKIVDDYLKKENLTEERFY